MADPKDTLLRQLALLSLIPELPRSTSTAVLREKLQERGFIINLRSVQRDLVRLSVMFPLCCADEGGRKLWSFAEGTSLDLRAMDAPVALALTLAEEHLQNLLPQTALDLLAPQFRKARNYLDGLDKNQLANWSKRVRAVPNGKSLLPATIASEVWAKVSEALLEHRQLKVMYQSRNKGENRSFVLHPASIISRHAVSYLIASVNDYNDLRQFALHRIVSAELLHEPAKLHESFDVDSYIREDLNTGSTIEQVQLVADIAPNIAWLLRETPLSRQQRIDPIDGSDWFRLQAQVPDDTETLWWVFGLGENMCVHEPAHWREQVRQKLAAMQRLYDSVKGDSMIKPPLLTLS